MSLKKILFERTMETEKGRQWIPKIKSLFQPLLVANILPKSFTNLLIHYVAEKRNFSNDDRKSLSTAIKSIVAPNSLRNIRQIILDLCKIGKINDLEKVIEDNIKKLTFYYGGNDEWTPKHFIADMKKKFPLADIRQDSHNITHAFVLQHSVLMAEITFKILSDKLMLSNNNDDRVYRKDIPKDILMAEIVTNIVVKRNVMFKKNDVVCRKKPSPLWLVEITATHFC